MSDFFRRAEAAQYLTDKGVRIKPATLARMACTGDGPRFRKDGVWPVYPREELDRWAEARLSPLVRSTSELMA